jgi:hypothetical protein
VVCPFREEHSLMLYENRVLRRLFRLKMNEVNGGLQENCK